jgi:hypothetical protein
MPATAQSIRALLKSVRHWLGVCAVCGLGRMRNKIVEDSAK